MKTASVWGLFLGLLLLTALNAAEVTLYGAKITKAEMAATDAPVLTLPEGWKLLEGEKFTGVNIREYYFTIEKEGKDLEAPIVQADWPNVEIAAAYGVTDFERTETGCRFQMKDHRTPTAFGTRFHFGAVSMRFDHHVEGLQAGLYRDKPYPKGEIAAYHNFMFASLEMLREAGLAQPDNSVDAEIILLGFETNFPNGHKDYPPHFHLMTMWDDWRSNQCPHIYLSPEGKVLYNGQYARKDGKKLLDQRRDYQPGEEVGLADRSGEVKIILSVLTDNSGIMMRLPGSDKEYKVSSDNALESVTLSVRADRSAPWEVKSVTRVNDDTINGVLTVETERNGQVEKEVWNYDPNTGNLMETK